ncbi:MAG: hypothetical protein HY824_13940 [Acidobacteria bacterium]|nr:hypothetical protein [Acidobacteriota bacterium]
MMNALFGLVASLLLLGMSAAPASAHHAFAAEFDATNCSEVTGILSKVDYQNPHAYLWVNTTGAGGQTEEATFQLSSTSNLRRGGATYAVLTASLGKTVIVRGCAARNGEKNRYAASFIKLADGVVQRVGQDVEGIFGTKIWR